MIRRITLVVTALVLVLAACGSDDTGDSNPPSTLATTTTTATPPPTEASSTTTTTVPSAFPVTLEVENGSVTIEAKPERIVSISPSATEILFGVGAGAQVVAVDSLSNYPAGAPVTDLSAINPNVEAIAAFEPDLVVLSYDPDGGLIPALEAIGVPAILQTGPVTVDAAYGQWTTLGAATGNGDSAAALVAATTASIERAYAGLPDGTDELSYYWELDPTFYSLTSTTFVGDLLSGTAMENIADDADADGWGYPQLTAEYIVGSNPGIIFLADTKCCGQTAVTITERPGWDTMTAVGNGAVVELDDDVASRWGPRIAELVEAVVAGIHDLIGAEG